MPSMSKMCCVTALVMVLFFSIDAAYAQTAKQEGWYRLRTNSVPYQPQNVAADSAGGAWVTAIEGTEYAPGVWYRPSGAATTGPSFQYYTNSNLNNLVSASYNPPVVNTRFSASVLYAAQDKAGNKWYSLKNRTVLCQKANGDWLTFTMPDSSAYQTGVDTTNVDSAHRIRFIDKQNGTQQEVLLIAYRGILRINPSLAVVETRQVYEVYNNYLIRDALIDSQGRYWITSEMGVEKGTSLVNTTYVVTLFPSDSNANTGTSTTRIVEDSLGNIWFNSSDGIYCYTNAGVWNKYATGAVNTFGKSVSDVAAGSNGAVWFGARYYETDDTNTGGLLKYAPTGGGQWTQYTQADLGLLSGAIPSMAFDGAGLWFVTDYNPNYTGNGTGVHYLTFNSDVPSVTHYNNRDNSTTLTSLRYNSIVADLSGGVWFPAYDTPPDQSSSIARLKADGSWVQYRQGATAGSFGSSGFNGAAVDSKNRVYFAPTNNAPVAYDVTKEQWISLPTGPSGVFYYGAYVDPDDGKWFYGAYGVYYLNPDNTAWTSINSDTISGFPANYYVRDGVLMDADKNVWFMAQGIIVLMKKNPDGGSPTWIQFTSGDASGYTGGYRVYQDDSGQIWNANSQKFVSATNTWVTATDTTAFTQRHFRFANGRVSAAMDRSSALAPITTAINPTLDEHYMTVDTNGTIYFCDGLGDVSAGIVAFGPPSGDVDGNGVLNLTDAILAAKVMTRSTAQALASGDINGDKKIGLAEMIYILQKLAGLR
jgi:hypothetical protein